MGYVNHLAKDGLAGQWLADTGDRGLNINKIG